MGIVQSKRDIGHAWKSISQAVRDSYICPEDLLHSQHPCRNSDGEITSLSTRCCPGRVGSLRKTMTDEQMHAVAELGFGSIMLAGEVNIKRKLCLKLLEQLDLDVMEINYEGVRITLSASEMGRVMGLPDKGSEVPLYGSEESIKVLKEKLCSHVRGIPINELVLTLKASRETDFYFRAMFTVLVMYTVLAPGSGVVIPHRYLHGAVDVENISKKNWAKWSFDYFVRGVKKFKKNIGQQNVCGNLLFLQVS